MSNNKLSALLEDTAANFAATPETPATYGECIRTFNSSISFER
jgi:hypothetical protein